ncbi:MAG: type II secretion system F family protein [Planctomycetes bacterium]|nr:type II secretion system F family protein [Planctomycetota bacterium]
MARFAYQARDGRGELATGVVNAANLQEASQMLRAEGKFIVRLKAESAGSGGGGGNAPSTTIGVSASSGGAGGTERLIQGRVKRDSVIEFANQLSVMVQTGVPLSDALQCCMQQAPNDGFKFVLNEVTKQVQAGGEFSAAMRKFPSIFPPIMTSLIRASEVSGTMGGMLDRVAVYLSKEQQTVKQVRGAMMYPLFMMTMAIGVTIFLLAFVLPKFAKIYESRGAALPAPTRLLLATSNGLVDYWYAWVILAVALGVSGFLFFRATAGRRFLDYLKLNMPVLRGVFTQLYISRACRTMGTMISAGVSMLDMVAIVKQVTNNVFFEELWDKVDHRLRQGSQLSDPLYQSALIPRSVSQMVFSGEKSGRLGVVLSKVAEYTEVEFDRTVKGATQFIEPLMVATMGLVIGFVAISLLLPIFSVGKVVAGK